MFWCNIYVIKNSVNKKVYVGQTWQTLGARFSKHKYSEGKSCRKLHNALKKYGVEKFGIHLLLITHTQEIADYWEDYFIDHFDSIENGYNIRRGGSKGKATQETRARMSIAQSGKSPSKETRQKMAAAKLGTKQSEQAKEKKSKSLMGNTNALGHKHSEETKKQMSRAHMGQSHSVSDESKEKMSAAKKKFSDDEARQLLKEYEAENITMKELAIKYGVSASTIQQTIERIKNE